MNKKYIVQFLLIFLVLFGYVSPVFSKKNIFLELLDGIETKSLKKIKSSEIQKPAEINSDIVVDPKVKTNLNKVNIDIKKLVEDDISSGKIIEHLPEKYEIAAKLYRKGEFGFHAKRVALALNGKNRKDINAFMRKEVKKYGLKPEHEPKQILYHYPDGSLVRIKPKGDYIYYKGKYIYSIEVKFLNKKNEHGKDAVAFKVTSDGYLVPKDPKHVNKKLNKLDKREYNDYLDTVMRKGHIAVEN